MAVSAAILDGPAVSGAPVYELTRVGKTYARNKVVALEDVVVPIVTTSATLGRFWSQPLSLVFIDGGHSLEAAMTDYRTWAGHLCRGGHLAIHDIFPDPSQGGQAPHDIYRVALASGLFEALPMTKTLGVLRRL